jgi:hypothetical protein
VANLNIIKTLKSTGKQLSSELESAGVAVEKRDLIVKVIEDQIAPAIDELENLDDALNSGGSDREIIMKNFSGKSGGDYYVDPSTGQIRKHLFV